MSDVETRNKDLVRRIYEELWNQGRLEIANKLFAEPAGVQKFVKEFLAAIPDLQHMVVDLIAEGDQVAAHFKAKGTHTGLWRQHAPKGNAIEYSGVTLIRIEGGKIVAHHTWWDTLEVIEQMARTW
jgi:predicted ester cyclase